MTAFTINNKPVVVLSDFDGTMTEHDVIMMIMAEFAPPRWRDIVSAIMDHKTLTIADGVRQLFSLLPSNQQAEIKAFVLAHVQLRSGLTEFLDFCTHHLIPFNVVSGGVDAFIQPVIAPFRDRVALYCNTARFDLEFIELDFPYAPQDCTLCNECACCKINVMDRYPRDQYTRIAIGDSVTDVGMAQTADIVFARSRLLQETKTMGIDAIAFETFDDIQSHILRLARPEAVVAC